MSEEFRKLYYEQSERSDKLQTENTLLKAENKRYKKALEVVINEPLSKGYHWIYIDGQLFAESDKDYKGHGKELIPYEQALKGEQE